MLELPGSVALAAVSSFMASRAAFLLLPVCTRLPAAPGAALAANPPQAEQNEGKVHLALDIIPALCFHFSAVMGCLKCMLTPGIMAAIGIINKGTYFQQNMNKKRRITMYKGFSWQFSWFFCQRSI